MGSGPEAGIQPAQVVEFGHQPEARVGHIEVVPQRRPLLEGPVKHILAIVGIRPAVKILLRAVIEARDAPGGVQEDQCHLEPGRGASGGGEETRVVVIIKIENQGIQRSGIIIRRSKVVVSRLDGPGSAGRGGEDAVHLVVQRVVQHAFHFVNAAAFGSRVGTAFAVRTVKDLAELEKVRLVGCLGGFADFRGPGVPETHLHVFHGIEAVGIESHGVDPVGPDFLHFLADVGGFGPEIIQGKQFPVLHLGCITPILRGAVVMEDVVEIGVSELGL